MYRNEDKPKMFKEPPKPLTPREIVSELDKYIIGQHEAKKAVAIALRNRWRRQQIEQPLQNEIVPKNIIMMGPTGVGKTEIARRLANLAQAPFMKIEATKFTEVGYVGRDVESMVRDLVSIAVQQVKGEAQEAVYPQAREMAEERLLSLLMYHYYGEDVSDYKNLDNNNDDDDDSDEFMPPNLNELPEMLQNAMGGFVEMLSKSMPKAGGGNKAEGGGLPPFNQVFANLMNELNPDEKSNDYKEIEQSDDAVDEEEERQKHIKLLQRRRRTLRKKLREGKLDSEVIEIEVPEKMGPMLEIFSSAGIEEMGFQMKDVFGNMFGTPKKKRKVTVKDAWDIFTEEESQKLIDSEELVKEAVRRVEQSGIIFIDEIDKIASTSRGSGSGPDVSREGVQRDILPLVEGSTVMTKYGPVKTNHILFIAAGAFHVSKPSDLIPELQGRFPIRVELQALTVDDFVRILVEPENSLVKQYKAMIETEGVELEFTDEAIKKIAEIAFQINESSENIGARRLYTVMEKLLEEVSFEAPELNGGKIPITPEYVETRLKDILADEDLSKFIL